jgi:hypothetical protein
MLWPRSVAPGEAVCTCAVESRSEPRQVWDLVSDAEQDLLQNRQSSVFAPVVPVGCDTWIVHNRGKWHIPGSRLWGTLKSQQSPA